MMCRYCHRSDSRVERIVMDWWQHPLPQYCLAYGGRPRYA